MANKINFITGETYTLAELFSGERKIIIPDLQRDYCWGNDNNTKSTGEKGELVTGFVDNLIEQFNEYQGNYKDKSTLNLGLFYGYEVPANHIQLCDGQQRLTTLYLLLGMIHKKTGMFRQHLISDFEYMHDDKEPYLNYAIRESSIYFLSDLVCLFFIDNHDKVEKIKLADWYYEEYNLDPSIQSILNALAKIELILSDKNLDLVDLGYWLLNKVTFLYFDMENRKNGEETFVVINTTGESLSSTQNLKPLVIQEKNDLFDNTSFCIKDATKTKNVNQCWEEIESWFWKKRKGDNDTADAGFAEFLRWVSIIEQKDTLVLEEEKTNSINRLIQLILQGKRCDFPYTIISFKSLYNYWQALKWIDCKSALFTFDDKYLSPDVNRDVNNRKAIDQKDCFVLLPLLRYVYLNISDIESSSDKIRNAKRIYEFFKNLIRIENVQKTVNTLFVDAIQIVEYISDNGDIINILDCKEKISSQLLTKEEIQKLSILKESSNREDIEESFWNAQEHPIWSGEIFPIIKWASSNGVFNYEKFLSYKEIFAATFNKERYSKISDRVRRALLTRDLTGYPRIFKGYTNISFGWNWNDWQTLINENVDKFKAFFDDLLAGKKLNDIIDNFNDTDNVFYRFIKYPELLSYCQQKNIQKMDISYRLIKQHKATSFLELETFCLYLEIKDSVKGSYIALDSDHAINYNGWKMWLWQKDSSALVFDKIWNELNVAIDIYYNTQQKDWVIQLFLRKNADEKCLETLADKCGLIHNLKICRFEMTILSKEDVLKKIEEVISMFNNCEF